VNVPIQPVALRCNIPMLPFTSPNVLGTTIIKELMFLFFVPYFKYELTLLPIMQKSEGEDSVSFAGRVQKAIADELGVVATQYSFKDALALRRTRMKTDWFGSVYWPSLNKYELKLL
jgi:hypothetical protein